ncbi:hypothetical protein SAMN05421866_2082 [Chryseobacterium oranimense]|uniref:Right handed beta helix region n=1 Tax=Chryseobacterium oranimense TaxID=421058 RepID=A0A1M5Q4Y1_9FLAO|nr:hypothetical protein [Chryseobacterium oranimense]SHH08809.1 hypothetical protein SAMN05421866_2082 [Chryseobacterium oranimense]
MLTTNEFFVSLSGPDDDFVQLIDSNTGEIVSFKKVNIWIDGTVLVINDPRVLNDQVIYRTRGNEFYVNTVVFSSKRVYITAFGAKSSYNDDQRAFIQHAFDICSELGLKLVFPSGHFLIKSFNSSSENILELRSGLDVEFEDYSVIKLDAYFDDSAFVLFSGLTADSSPLYNISFKGKGIIDFGGDVSKMRSLYLNRVGFEGGNCTNVLIDGLYWTNGDLRNCIAVGKGNSGGNVTIRNCTFDNLTTGTKEINHDHSTIYGNVDFLSVHNNVFIGNRLMSLIGCACEIHSSHSSFDNNKVYDYTRMNFVASYDYERKDITNISITNNIAEITNTVVYFWSNVNSLISNVLISGNNVRQKHIEGETQNYNGHQGLLSILNKGGKYERIIAKGNSCHILYTIGDHLRYAADIFAGVDVLEISDNNFSGHSLGFLLDKEESDLLGSYSFVKISGNSFTSLYKLVTLNAEKVTHSLISDNSASLETNNLTDLIEINSNAIQSTTIRNNTYLNNKPSVEFTPSSAFKADSTNNAKYILSLIDTPVPTINANDYDFIIPYFSNDHKRVGAMYTIQPSYPFQELFFHAVTFGKGGSANVDFKVDNIAPYTFPANNLLKSNIIVEM